jgi:hypothetical protein
MLLNPIFDFMKHLFLFFSLFFSLVSFGQQYATTDNGKRVKLNEDGTWKYEVRETPVKESELKTYTKPSQATKLVQSAKNNFAFWYDASKWTIDKKTDNDAAEFSLSIKGEDGYAMLISERLEIDLASLKDVAISNAREEDPNMSLDKEEYRMVNGIKVLHLQMSGKMSGVKFTYIGYYCSNEKGTVQFVCYTGTSLLPDYQKDFENLLNGLVVVNK